MKRIKTSRQYEISDEEFKTRLNLSQHETITAIQGKETTDNAALKKWLIVTTQKE